MGVAGRSTRGGTAPRTGVAPSTDGSLRRPARAGAVVLRSGDRPLVVALAAVAVGALPPWLLANPFYDGVAPAVYRAGQASGLETWGAATLPLAVLAVGALIAREGRPPTTAAALVGAGAAVVALEVTYTGVVVPYLLPGPGAVLSLVAGAAAVALAARRLGDPER